MTTSALLAELHRRLEAPKVRGEKLFASLMRQDEKLVAKGFQPMTPWWREAMRRFYISGKRRLVCRVGRKGTKSATMCRVAVNEVLNGDHPLSPGDMGLFMFISESTYEAKGRIFTIKAILDALGVQHEPLDRDTRIVGKPLSFGVRAGRVGAVSGPVVIGLVNDEVAKWKDEETGANPATEVLRSVRPAMATQPNAHEFDISSPWSTIDAHAEMMAEGDTIQQTTAEAPTWVANPNVTEAATRELEPDEATWEREYGAKPMASNEVNFFHSGAIDEAVKRGGHEMPLKPKPGVTVTGGGDLAFERNCAVLAIGHRYGPWDDTKAMCAIADILEKRPQPGKPLFPGEVIGEFATKMRQHQINCMMADGHYRMAAIEHLTKHSLYFADAPTGNAGKALTYVRFRVVLHDGRLILPGGELGARLARQLKEVTSKPTAGAGLQIRSPTKAGGAHGDIVSGSVLAVWQQTGVLIEETERRPATREEWVSREAEREEREDEEWIKRQETREWWEDDG